MNFINSDSSIIRKIGYDAVNLILEVMFERGATYQYFDVDYVTMVNFVFAKSQGAYLNRSIAKEFKYEQIN